MSLTTSFRQCFFNHFASHLAAAHTPGHSLGEVAALLNPNDIVYQLARGADEACGQYRSLINATSHAAIEHFMETSSAEANQIQPIYQQLVGEMQRINDITLVGRFWPSPKEVMGDFLGFAFDPTPQGVTTQFFEKMFSAIIDVASETVSLGRAVSRIDGLYDTWCNQSIPRRFHRNVIPEIESAVRRY